MAVVLQEDDQAFFEELGWKWTSLLLILLVKGLRSKPDIKAYVDFQHLFITADLKNGEDTSIQSYMISLTLFLSLAEKPDSSVLHL